MTGRKTVEVDGYRFGEGELEWAREHLGDMRRTLRGNTFLLSMLAMAFVLGIVFYLLADAVTQGTLALPEGWRADLIGDFLYNLGVILWTSVVVALFLEVGVEYSQRQAQRYYERVVAALRAQGIPVPEEQARLDEEALTARLDAIQAKLATLDRLQTEMSALRIEVARLHASTDAGADATTDTQLDPS